MENRTQVESLELQKIIHSKQDDIEKWFQAQWLKTRAPVYGSVDLRNAGFKLAPIDMNLFPAGFNNLEKSLLPLSIEAAKASITQLAPHTKKILLIPESHTRNLFYWDNIQTLLNTLREAGFETRLGSLLPDYKEPTELVLKNGEKIQIESIVRHANSIGLNHFNPDVILLNNDLSNGIPDILTHLQQPILPPVELGWSQRLKSNHFEFYRDVANEFSELIDIDPWFIAPLFRHCGEIDFMNRNSEDCLTKHVGELLEAIKKKYNEYQINAKPFLIVKADTGTYGMAVMTVRDVDEVRNLNRKQRTSMSKSKGGQRVQKIIVQEGVYTFETGSFGNAVAEPVVYMWGQHVIGGFYRVHEERGVDENLNSPGMRFEAIDPSLSQNKFEHPFGCKNQFYAYGVIARLSMLAAAREMRDLKS